jgi:phage nucleotide-binding protein
MQIQSTKDIQPTTLTILVYGQAGAGKTTLASTLEGKTLVVSAESGLLSLKDFTVDYVTVEGASGKEKLANLRSIISEVNKSDYENVFIDSLTEISQILYDDASQAYPNDSHTQKRYGLVKENTIKMIKYLRDMKKNVILTALEKVDKNDQGRRFMYPNLIGSSAVECPGFFDFVFHLEVFEKDEKKIRALLTDAKDNVLAKSRTNTLKEYEPANLQLIFNKLKGGSNV